MKNTGIGMHGGSRRPAARPAIVCIVVGALALLGPWWSGIAAAQSAGCPDAIRIGMVFPMTGREGRPGTYQVEGIRLAMELINAKGGVYVKECGKRLPFKEILYDDQSDQGRTVQLVERTMSSDDVVAVLGAYSSTLGQAQSVVPDRYQVPWISPGAGASMIYSQGRKWIFGVLSPVDLLGYTTMKFLGSLVDQGKLDKGLKIAIAVENTDHGKDYVEGVNRWIKENPSTFKVVFNESFQLGGADFSGILQRIKAANADIFLSDAHLQDYIAMQRQYTQMGLRHRMVSYWARGPEEPARKALGPAADYIFAGLWWHKDLPYPQVKAFVQEHKKKYQREPDSYYPATGYDAVRALAASIESAGSLDRTSIRNALLKVRLTDSLLPGQVLQFPANGQVLAPFVIGQNKPDGKVDFVYPEDSRTGEVVTRIPR
jgi:branched-chain amino acid transport system substrate-binding protein